VSALLDNEDCSQASTPAPLAEAFLARIPETSANLIQAILSRCDYLVVEMPAPDTRKDD
jgi:hypothetical protein